MRKLQADKSIESGSWDTNILPEGMMVTANLGLSDIFLDICITKF
jgi:hypothetical protein